MIVRVHWLALVFAALSARPAAAQGICEEAAGSEVAAGQRKLDAATYVGDVYQRRAVPGGYDLLFGGWGDQYFVYLKIEQPPAGTARGILCIYATSIPRNDPALRLEVVLRAWDPEQLSISERPPSVDVGPAGRVLEGWNAIDLGAALSTLSTGHGLVLSPSRNDETNGSFASPTYPESTRRPFVLWYGEEESTLGPQASQDTADLSIGEAYAARLRRWNEERGGGHRGAIPASQALRLLRLALQDAGFKFPAHRSSYATADWSAAAGLVRIGDEPQLMLGAPTFGGEVLTIAGLLDSSEVLAVVGRRTVALIDNPLGHGPSANGLWLNVSTLDQRVGWIFATPHGEAALAEEISRPQPKLLPEPIRPTADGEWLRPVLLTAVGLLIVVVLTRKASTPTGPRTDSGAHSDSSSRGERTDDEGNGRSSVSDRDASGEMPIVGTNGSTVYRKTGWFSEDEVGRVDHDGTIYHKTGMFSEDEVGRVDDDGNVYKKTGFFSEEQTHRIDEDGTIYEKKGWFSEEKVGRVDDDGNVYRSTGWFSEEQVGRVEDKDEEKGCFISSACARAAGLPDDCDALQTLRTFRDEYLEAQGDGPELIAEYYRIAPRIVSAINASPDAASIYRDLYQRLVLSAVAEVVGGRPTEATKIYREIVEELRDRLLR